MHLMGTIKVFHIRYINHDLTFIYEINGHEFTLNDNTCIY